MSYKKLSGLTIVCSRPVHFAVETQDNGYQASGMQKWQQNTKEWHQRLLTEWDRVARELGKRGAHLIMIPPQQGLHDQVFAADSAVYVRRGKRGDFLLPSKMNSPNRQQEVSHAVNHAHAHGFKQARIEATLARVTHHEGTGDLHYLPGHDVFLQGYGPRSHKGTGRLVAQLLGRPVIEVPLQQTASSDPHALGSKETKGFHLDTLIWPLPDKHLIYCPTRLAPETRKVLEKLYPNPKQRLAITEIEADLFITNGLSVPDDKYPRKHILFIPETSPPRVRDRLRSWGFGCLGFDFEPSKLAGGGLHCMFNKVFDVPTQPKQRDRKIHPKFHRPNGRVKCYRPSYTVKDLHHS